MNKHIVLLLTILLVVTGCARVNLGLDKKQNIKFDRAGGYASPERGLNILERQANTKTSILLHEKLRKAIKANNETEIAKIIKMIENLFGNGMYGQRVAVDMKNGSSYSFEVMSGEFKGLTLAPGEISPNIKYVPCGLYIFNVRFVDNNNYPREWPVSRMITSLTNRITLKNVRR